MTDSRSTDDLRAARLQRTLADPRTGRVAVCDLVRSIRAAGLRPDDRRWGAGLRGLFEAEQARPLADDDLQQLTAGSLSLIERAVHRELVIPDFPRLRDEVEELFEAARSIDDGAVATYIPQLARVDPAKWGLGLCTIDGQRLVLGDALDRFCVQSTCKPINYCVALETSGEDVVHRHIGHEPSGQGFNELSLNDEGLPHNPMINAGGIMACALVGSGKPASERFDEVVGQWARLTGGVRPGFDNAVYQSERKTADRNFALGYFMREHGAFPAGTDLLETLEFYFQCCSLELDCDDFAVVAATLANGGVCPVTEERVLSPDTVRACLSMMESCGMYDFSGEWAFSVGLPAKSGVSGVILVVVPNTLGFAVWSPRLDEHGNSVRGVTFCKELVARYNFHQFDNLVGCRHGKRDPRREPFAEVEGLCAELLWAAKNGDLHRIRRLEARGVDLASADYDGRTALHLAYAEGRQQIVDYLLARGVPTAVRDRFGRTPAEGV